MAGICIQGCEQPLGEKASTMLMMIRMYTLTKRTDTSLKTVLKALQTGLGLPEAEGRNFTEKRQIYLYIFSDFKKGDLAPRHHP